MTSLEDIHKEIDDLEIFIIALLSQYNYSESFFLGLDQKIRLRFLFLLIFIFNKDPKNFKLQIKTLELLFLGLSNYKNTNKMRGFFIYKNNKRVTFGQRL